MKNYKLGNTKSEKHKILKEVINYYENKNMSLEEIAKIYDVSKQAISLKLTKAGYIAKVKNKRISRIGKENELIQCLLKDIEKLKKKNKALRVYNCNLRKTIKEMVG